MSNKDIQTLCQQLIYFYYIILLIISIFLSSLAYHFLVNQYLAFNWQEVYIIQLLNLEKQ